MTAKSVLVRPQGLRPRARAPTCLPFATPLSISVPCAKGQNQTLHSHQQKLLSNKVKFQHKSITNAESDDRTPSSHGDF